MIMLQNNPGDYETSTRSLQKHRQESKSKQITEVQNVLLASESKLLLYQKKATQTKCAGKRQV